MLRSLNVIKFKLNHAAKIICKIKFDHLQIEALQKSPVGLHSKHTSQKRLPLVTLTFPQQTQGIIRKAAIKFGLQCSAQYQEEASEVLSRGSQLGIGRYKQMEVRYRQLTSLPQQ